MTSDHFSTRTVVLALAIVVVGGLGALVFLASTGTTIPDALDRLIFTALGSLGTILSRPSVVEPPVPVEVVGVEAAEG